MNAQRQQIMVRIPIPRVMILRAFNDELGVDEVVDSMFNGMWTLILINFHALQLVPLKFTQRNLCISQVYDEAAAISDSNWKLP